MKKTLLYTIFTALVFVSCSDFLEVEPDEQTSIEQQLSTKNGVLEAYTGIYRDIEILLSSQYHIYADVQGGNITFTPEEVSKVLDVPINIENSYSFTDNYQNSEYGNYYEDLYEIINQVNVILERVGNFSFFTTEEINQLQAELYTVRAFAHYQVATHYAQQFGLSNGANLGVVYNTRPLVAGVDFPSRTTLTETYNLLKTDLDQALSLYNGTQLLDGANYSYFNAINTQALYARIALQMNDWQRAQNLSNAVITSSGVSLVPQNMYVDEWKKNLEPINEVLLEFTAPRTTEGNVSSSISSFYNFVDSGNYGDFVASGDLVAMYDANDIRRELFFTENLVTLQNGVEVALPYVFTHKYQGESGTLFIRLSEMYLIRAEAEARLGNTFNAIADVNSIRNRANLPSITATANVLDEIFNERRRELAFEGFLLFDIARFQKNVERNLGCLGTVCNLNYPSDFFVLPIPASSVDLNQNIQQNEGY